MKLSVIATKYSWLMKHKEPQAKNLGNPDGRGGGESKNVAIHGEEGGFFLE